MKRSGFTLIELTVVVAIVATASAFLFVPMIRHLDRIAGEKETGSLRSMARAFEQRVRTTRTIPNETDWANALATQLGLQVEEITATERRGRRVYLIDPSVQIGQNSSTPNIPYVQPLTGSMVTNASGNIIAPVNPRFLLVSSISRPLPDGLTSGVGATTGAYAFDNLWETIDGTVPNGWTWPDGDDLRIQRIDLSDLFVQVVLNNRDTNLTAYYAIDTIGTNAVPYGGLGSMYFLKDTEIKLLNAAQELEYTEVLHESTSFTFELGTWQAGSFLAQGVGQPGPLDLQRVMNLFLSAPANQYAQFGATQAQVYDLMIAYMSNFIVWRDAGYPGEFQGSGQPPKELSQAQSDLDTVTSDLINPR